MHSVPAHHEGGLIKGLISRQNEQVADYELQVQRHIPDKIIDIQPPTGSPVYYKHLKLKALHQST